MPKRLTIKNLMALQTEENIKKNYTLHGRLFSKMITTIRVL